MESLRNNLPPDLSAFLQNTNLNNPEETLSHISQHDVTGDRLLAFFRAIADSCTSPENYRVLAPLASQTISYIQQRSLNSAQEESFSGLMQRIDQVNVKTLKRKSSEELIAPEEKKSKTEFQAIKQWIEEDNLADAVKNSADIPEERILELFRQISPDQVKKFVHAALSSNGCHALPIVKAFLQTGWGINNLFSDGQALLHLAASQGDKELVTFLIDTGADLAIEFPTNKSTPIHFAARNGQADIVALLLDKGGKGATIETRNIEGAYPLSFAAVNGDVRTIKLLLSRGANVDAADFSGGTPLQIATVLGHEAAAQILLDYGANVNAKIADNHLTPLHFAIRKGSLPLVHLLIERGADIHINDTKGRNLLYHAAMEGKIDIFKALLAKNVDINAKGAQGRAQLYNAIMHQETNVIRIFLEHGADITVKEFMQGYTLLHFAILKENVDAVKLLLEHGADITIGDNIGRPSLDLALSGNCTEIKALLRLKALENKMNPLSKAFVSLQKEQIAPLFSQGVQREEEILTQLSFVHHDRETLKTFFSDIPELLPEIEKSEKNTIEALAEYAETHSDTIIPAIVARNENPFEVFMLKGFLQPMITDICAKASKEDVEKWVKDFVKKYPHSMQSIVNSLFSTDITYWAKSTHQEKIPPAPPNVAMKNYTEILERFQYNNADAPYYVDPNTLTMDGKATTSKTFAKAVAKFIEKIEQNTPFLGTPPANTPALKEFYEAIELRLKHVFAKVNAENDPEKKHQNFLKVCNELATASGYCGPRYLAMANALYYKFCLGRELGFEESVAGRLDELRELALDTMAQEDRDVNQAQNVHAVSYFRNVLSKRFLWQDAISLLAQQDPFHKNGFNNYETPEKNDIIENFLNHYYSPKNIIETLVDLVQGSDEKGQYLTWAQQNLKELCPGYEEMHTLQQNVEKKEHDLVASIQKKYTLPKVIDEYKARLEKMRTNDPQRKSLEEKIKKASDELEQFNEKVILNKLSEMLIASEIELPMPGYTYSDVVKDEINGRINEWLCDQTGSVKLDAFLLALKKLSVVC